MAKIDWVFGVLASLQPPKGLLEQAQRVVIGDEERLGRCFTAARRERVLPQVVANLADAPWRQKPQGLVDAERYVHARCEWTDRMHDACGLVVKAIGPRRCILVKGLAVARYYPKENFREFNDADIVLPDPNDVWATIGVLRAEGYKIGKLRIALRNDGHFHGIMPCRRSFEGRVGGYAVPGLGMDIHFGGFPCLDQGLLPFRAGDTAHDLTLADVRCNALTPTASILLLASHTIRQGYVRVRELNDLRVLAALIGSEDWPFLWARAAAESVDTTLRLVLALAGIIGDDSRGTWWKRLVGGHLLDPGSPDKTVHGGRRLLWSRLLQLHHLSRRFAAREGVLRAVPHVLRAVVPLLSTGRSYAIRRVATISRLMPGAPPCVYAMMPVEGLAEMPQIAANAAQSGLELQRLGNVALLIDPGHEGEVLAAPGCVFRQSGYFGEVPAEGWEAARRTLTALQMRFPGSSPTVSENHTSAPTGRERGNPNADRARLNSV